MVGVSTYEWELPERWTGMAFLVGGMMFVADTALVVAHLISGTEPGALDQAFVGAAWTAAFIGLFGMYPRLAEQNRRLTQAGSVFAGVGAITMATKAITSLGYFMGVLSGELPDVDLLFLPAMFLGIIPAFILYSVASLRTERYPWSIGVLFLALPLTFLFDVSSEIAGFNPGYKVLGVLLILATSKLIIGYQLRIQGELADAEIKKATSDSVVR